MLFIFELFEDGAPFDVFSCAEFAADACEDVFVPDLAVMFADLLVVFIFSCFASPRA